jgi:transcriptional regulator with XRE-family HTH domain
MDYQKTGFLIASLRKEKGLTQKELADKLGITDRAVSKWERGLGSPDISLLDDLSRILDISILEILKGRRLDKDEIVNNESIIESMNYSKDNLKYKFKKYFNLTCIFVIIMISLILIVSNLKSIYYLNKTYHHNFYDNSTEKSFSEIQSDIEKIKSNQGIYSDDDYKKILVFIDELDKNLKTQNNSYYYSKKDYSFADIVKFYDCHQKYTYDYPFSKNNEAVYDIVLKYDSSIVNNVVSYYRYSHILTDYSINLYKQSYSPYYNGENVSNEIGGMVKGFIIFENNRDNILLNDIIKAGAINE